MRQHFIGLHLAEITPAEGLLIDAHFLELLFSNLLQLSGFFLWWLTQGIGRRLIVLMVEHALEAGGVTVAGKLGIGLSLQVELVELFHEEQIGDLLDGGEGIGNASGPEAVPEFIDEGFEFRI